MNQIFRFDVTLKELMNLGVRAKESKKLDLIFNLLQKFWYDLEDKHDQEERENRIRVGSVEVYLDEDSHLHIDFLTRFSFASNSKILQFLDLIKKID